MAKDAWDRSERLLFAYGPDAHPRSIERDCPGARVVGPARLDGFRIAFRGRSAVWDGGVAALVPEAGSSAWGVVLSLGFAEALRLDDGRDVRLDGAGSYFHYPAEAFGPGGERLHVLFYKKDQLGPPSRPSREQLEYMYLGGVELGLPLGYLRSLLEIESLRASYPVPRIARSCAADLSTPCDCGDLRSSRGGPGLEPKNVPPGAE